MGRVVELHGTSQGKIRMMTPPIDCTGEPSIRIRFSQYLRLEPGVGSSARVVGSVDGGSTFPFVVWESGAAGRTSEEGTVVIRNQTWAAGERSVALRFEYRGGWYWRVGAVTITSDTAYESEPVSALTIAALDAKGVRLRWQSNSAAESYVVLAKDPIPSDGSFVTIATTQDTTFTDESSEHYASRLYQVRALLRSENASVTGPAVERESDLNWTRKVLTTPR
jgi:hypothetical protein